jgi:hypothetical protein
MADIEHHARAPAPELLTGGSIAYACMWRTGPARITALRAGLPHGRAAPAAAVRHPRRAKDAGLGRVPPAVAAHRRRDPGCSATCRGRDHARRTQRRAGLALGQRAAVHALPAGRPQDPLLPPADRPRKGAGTRRRGVRGLEQPRRAQPADQLRVAAADTVRCTRGPAACRIRERPPACRHARSTALAARTPPPCFALQITVHRLENPDFDYDFFHANGERARPGATPRRACVLPTGWFSTKANLPRSRHVKPPVRGTGVLDSGVAQCRYGVMLPLNIMPVLAELPRFRILSCAPLALLA